MQSCGPQCAVMTEEMEKHAILQSSVLAAAIHWTQIERRSHIGRMADYAHIGLTQFECRTHDRLCSAMRHTPDDIATATTSRVSIVLFSSIVLFFSIVLFCLLSL